MILRNNFFMKQMQGTLLRVPFFSARNSEYKSKTLWVNFIFRWLGCDG